MTYYKYIISAECDNEDGGSEPVSVTLTHSETREYTESFAYTLGFEIKVGTTFEAGIPSIGAGAVSVEITNSHEWTWGNEITESQTLSVDTEVSCAQGEIIEAYALIWSTNFYVPYIMTVRATSRSGVAWNFYSHGEWTGANYWRIRVESDLIN